MPETPLRTYIVNVGDKESASAFAAALASRGHRFVRIVPIGNRWRTISLVDDADVDPKTRTRQWIQESAVLAGLARRYRGYLEPGGLCFSAEGFGAEGLAHSTTASETRALRRASVAAFPVPRPQPIPPERPLSAPNGDDARPPLFEVLRSLAPAGSWWHTEQAADFAGFDEVDLVCEIDDYFMHQGSCYEHTPREVPLIAALAARDEVHPALRATLVDSLFSAATAGRRQVAQDVDRRNALGLPHDERPTELLVRQAVAATAPALLTRWDDECDLMRFALGLLAAAFPEHGRPLAVELRTWAVDEGATPRGRVLRLMADLAGQDPDLDVTLAAMVADGFGRTPPSPVAPAEGAAFSVLQEWAELELSAPLEAL